MPEQTAFGAWLRQRRKDLDLTQDMLAERVGCSSEMIRGVEMGRARPSRVLAGLLVASLDVPLPDQPAFVAWARGGPAPAAPAPPTDPRSHPASAGTLTLLPTGSDGRARPEPPAAPAPPSDPRSLLQVIPAERPAAPRGRPGPSVRLSNLPPPLTDFIGREPELARLAALLRRETARLVTLTGPGGVGKTRLAVQVATGLLADPAATAGPPGDDAAGRGFADGVWLVELAPLADPELVADTIAATLQVQERGERTVLASLQEYLRPKQLLLVLDNFEHLLAATPVVAALLSSAPELKFLVTSREPLHLYGEHEFPVPPLDLPPMQPDGGMRDAEYEDGTNDTPQYGVPTGPRTLQSFEAVRLFVERARAVKPDFALTPQTAPAVAAICVRLDGLPLAIELAAARSKLLPPAALLARLASRLATLTGGPRNVPARHQTLRAAIAWSYDLLSPAEQQLFRRLSVFHGGCPLAALAVVCGTGEERESDLLALAEALVSKSLVQPAEHEGAARLRLLETLREFADEQLVASGEGDWLRDRHLDYFQAWAARAEPELQGPQQAAWLAQCETERDNLRAALDWAEGSDPAAGLRIMAALTRFWAGRGHYSEGLLRLQRLLALAPEATPVRARALLLVSELACRLGDYAAAQRACTESLHLSAAAADAAGVAEAQAALGWVYSLQGEYTQAHAVLDPALAAARGATRGLMLHILGDMAWRHGDFPAARAYAEEGLTLYQALGDQAGIARILRTLGSLDHHQGHYDRARARHEESLALAQELGDRVGSTAALSNLGIVAYYQGEYATAQARHAAALALSRELGDRAGIARALTNLGTVADAQGDYPAAEQWYRESLALFRELGARWNIANALANLGEVVYYQGDDTRAQALLEEGLAECRALGHHLGSATVLRHLGAIALRQGRPAAAQALWQESLALHRATGDQAASAACLAHMGIAALARGAVASAEDQFRVALQESQEIGATRESLAAVIGLAGVAARQGQAADAAGWLAAATRQATARGCQLDPLYVELADSITAQTRETLGPEAYARAVSVGQALTWPEVLVAAQCRNVGLPLPGAVGPPSP